MFQLLPWQQPVADRLHDMWSQHPVVVNSSETGSGKTYVSLEVARRFQCPVFVVCPKIARSMWRDVAAQAGVNLVAAVNPERLSLELDEWFRNNRWNLPAGTRIIWDEVHKGPSGAKSKTGKVLALTKAYNIPVLMMSATFADSPLKMRATGYLLGLHQFTSSSFFQWAAAHGCYPSGYHRGLEFSKGPKGRAALARIHEAIRGRMIRLRIDEIPGFPESFVRSKLIDLTDEYREMTAKAYAEMDERMKKPGASMLTELIHARERAEFCKVEVLADLTTDELEEGKSVVVFLNFRSVLARLAEQLKSRGTEVVQIYGTQPDKERQAAIDGFQANRVHVCLCMIQAGGVSVSLHDVRHERGRVSFMTPGFSASETVQALGRIHRTGGTRSVQTILLTSGTVEERVHRQLSRKLGDIKTLQDGDLQ